ncbi:MAG: glycoside hydrolase family 3 protein [Promicromonosporaceae bacterium]|nr:glycoside hydrolase family 3 protein [Promicromonosporaceae bacterium]
MDLSKAPFNLDETGIKWVTDTLATMDADDKLGQLFCQLTYSDDDEYLADLAKNKRVGGVMLRNMPVGEASRAVTTLQTSTRIPMLIAANLEAGVTQTIPEGTHTGALMAIGATGDPKTAATAAKVIAAEAMSVGINWSFGPVIDLDLNYRNPIVATRAFGGDTDLVAQMGAEYVTAMEAAGMATSIKHWPGDGVDDRDQHLLNSVNTMTVEEWDATFRKVYQASIDAGARTVMAGHIMLPEYSKALCPGLADKDVLPGLVAKELLNDLLRGSLGFNGLVVTDATTMSGMAQVLPRKDAVPATIAAGCDMFLFTKNFDEDYGYMREGIANGTITPERLDEAITRILALKASLGLHLCDNLPAANAAELLRTPEHVAVARDIAARSVTLVKEEAGVLPITPERYKRVLFYGLEGDGWGYGISGEGILDGFMERLREAGHEVTKFEPAEGWEGRTIPTTDVTDNYDLIVYLANLSVKSNQTCVRIVWKEPMGADVPEFITTTPTVFISVENPYHLLDVPRVRTFINTYNSSPYVFDHLMAALCGEAEFQGTAPTDPFLGRWDTRL